MRGFRPLGLALLVLFGVLYHAVPEHGFVWDDVQEIAHNPLLEGPLLDGLTASQHAHMGVHHSDQVVPAYDSYRPLRYLSYRLDAALFGITPRPFHVHNLLLALSCGAASALFLWTLTASRAAALAGAALVLLHPLAVEPIVYISARSDLQASLWTLLSCSAALHFLRGAEAHWLVASWLGYLVSLTAKEALFALPFTLVLVALERGRTRRFVTLALGWIVCLGGFFAVRAQFASSAGESHVADALRALGPTLALYARAFVMPLDCSVVRPAPAPDALLSLGLAGAGITLFGLALRTRRADLWRALHALAWLCAALFPSSIAARTTGVASDRYAYLALLSLPMLGAGLAPHVRRAPRALRLAAGLAGGALAIAQLAISAGLVPAFRDPVALYEHAISVAPDAGAAYYGLGQARAERDGCAAAEPLFERAIALSPRHIRALNNLGVCRMRRGALVEARAAFRGALDAASGLHPRAAGNLAQVELLLGQRAAACEAARRALAVEPTQARARSIAAEACSP
jgi:protein O-mannosyl-transferase